MPGVEKQKVFQDYRQMNPTVNHSNKLIETIKKAIAKFHIFDGDPDKELTSWLDLMTHLICLDPRARYTAKQALDHDFFKEEPLACDPADLIPAQLKNDSQNDFHEFITKCEKNKKQNFRKEFTFKHNIPNDDPAP
jgi:serine/threonine protein kinase